MSTFPGCLMNPSAAGQPICTGGSWGPRSWDVAENVAVGTQGPRAFLLFREVVGKQEVTNGGSPLLHLGLPAPGCSFPASIRSRL